MPIERKQTKAVNAGGLIIGGRSPVSVQSMCNTDTRDVEETLKQIARLRRSGCKIVRVAVPDSQAASSLGKIVQEAGLPICADIHFDHRLALKSMEQGVHKIRINPGNIGSDEKVGEVVKAASERSIPIRIGVNSGSIAPDMRARFGNSSIALAESALKELAFFERFGFYDTVLSVKSSDVMDTVEANRYISSKVSYPLHLGVTEAGPPDIGAIRSAAALGALLMEGIGDTIRISLTGDPEAEVWAGRELLSALGLAAGLKIISCPTCGRTRGDVSALVAEVRRRLSGTNPDITVAVMGCEVNGPGEARGADFAIACGAGRASIYVKGEIVDRVTLDEAAEKLIETIQKTAPGVGKI